MTFQPEFEGVDPHTHGDHADAFYVLEGQVEFRVGDEPRVAGPGTFVAAPPGTGARLPPSRAPSRSASSTCTRRPAASSTACAPDRRLTSPAG